MRLAEVAPYERFLQLPLAYHYYSPRCRKANPLIQGLGDENGEQPRQKSELSGELSGFIWKTGVGRDEQIETTDEMFHHCLRQTATGVVVFAPSP